MNNTQQIYEWYESLSHKQRLAFWLYAKEKVFEEIVMDSFLKEERLTRKQLLEYFECDYWNEIPELFNYIEATQVERGI